MDQGRFTLGELMKFNKFLNEQPHLFNGHNVFMGMLDRLKYVEGAKGRHPDRPLDNADDTIVQITVRLVNGT